MPICAGMASKGRVPVSAMPGARGRLQKRERDANAPKRPYNAYTIFYKHYLEQFNRKMPNSSLDSRQLTMQIGKAWKSLSDVEKEVSLSRGPHPPPSPSKRRPTRRRRATRRSWPPTRRATTSASSRVSAPTPDGRLQSVRLRSCPTSRCSARSSWPTTSASLTVLPQHPLAAREAELRQLRKEIGAVDSEAGPIVDRIGRLQSALEEFEQGELSRREKMLGVWTRKLIPELQAAGLMQELGLTPLSSPAALIAALESACAEEGGSQKRRLHSALARVYLPTTPV